MTALTAHAAHMAELRAENAQLRKENAILLAMQVIVDAKAAKLAAQPMTLNSPCSMGAPPAMLGAHA